MVRAEVLPYACTCHGFQFDADNFFFRSAVEPKTLYASRHNYSYSGGLKTVSAVQLNFDYEHEVRTVIETHRLKETTAEFVRKAGVQRMDRLRGGDDGAR